jgi:hypothetical protein
MQETRITLTVTTNSAEILTRTTEAMARTVAGLALEGVEPMLYTSTTETDD